MTWLLFKDLSLADEHVLDWTIRTGTGGARLVARKDDFGSLSRLAMDGPASFKVLGISRESSPHGKPLCQGYARFLGYVRQSARMHRFFPAAPARPGADLSRRPVHV